MGSLDREFVESLRAQLEQLSIDETKQRIEERMRGRVAHGLMLPKGTFIYRARKVSASFHPKLGLARQDLSYPPKKCCPAGRLNRAGFPLFYASMSKSPLLFELGAQPGEEFVISIWRVDEQPIISTLGYTSSVLASLGSDGGQLLGLPSRDQSKNVIEDDALSDVFAERVQAHERIKYKLTAAIGELHYGLLEGGRRKFGGVMYPSVAMWANGDNVALLPWFVDEHLQITKAIHLKVNEAGEKSYSIDVLDESRRLDEEGCLVWQGYPGTRLKKPGNLAVVFKAGRDQLGDYVEGKDCIGHWVATDTGTGCTFAL